MALDGLTDLPLHRVELHVASHAVLLWGGEHVGEREIGERGRWRGKGGGGGGGGGKGGGKGEGVSSGERERGELT